MKVMRVMISTETSNKKEKIENYTNELLNSANKRGTKQGVVVYKAILDMLKKADNEEEE